MTNKHTIDTASKEIAEKFALAVSLQNQNKLKEAVALYHEILLQNPSLPEVYYNLALINHALKDYKTAEILYSHALKLEPYYLEALNNLGNLYMQKLDFCKALRCLSTALTINPDYYEALCNIAMLFVKLRNHKSALKCFEKILKLNPNNPANYSNYANTLKSVGLYEEAIANYQKAIELDKDFYNAYSGLGSLYFEAGLLDEAIKYYQKGLACKPIDNSKFHYLVSNYLYALNYRHDLSNEDISLEHFNYRHYFEPCDEKAKDTTLAYNGNCKVKVGFVSPDFKAHPVAYFINPLFKAYDSNRFEFYCYSDEAKEDIFMKHLKLYNLKWRDTATLSDSELYSVIKNDQIDILFDLSGHTGSNRLKLFGLKPAKIQVSYLGYPNTTGLKSIDYKIVDHYTDPVGLTEHLYSESLIRLKDCFLCYMPWSVLPPVLDPPALKNGFVTFGCFNKITKVSDYTIGIWSKIMSQLPNARLFLKSKHFDFIQARQTVIARFAKYGIDESRLILCDWTDQYIDHLTIYSLVDICLDPFPYNGTTNTCESLSMGVPVITLVGSSHVSRVGLSILTNAGLPEFVTYSEDEYVTKTVELASDLAQLSQYRKQIRKRLFESKLADVESFVASFHTACEEMLKGC